MDERRLDTLARRLAGRLPRRRVLGGLGGGAFGAVLTGVPPGTANGGGATGSVTARVFVCPPRLSPGAVWKAADPAALLADCAPTSAAPAAPRLRALPNGASIPGRVFAPGVYLWHPLPFGAYDFGGGGAPAGFGGRLIANGDGVPVADQERGEVKIAAVLPHIERRFYSFAPSGPATGAISLTVYRCPSGDDLSPGACRPVDLTGFVAGIIRPGWIEPALAGFVGARVAWSGLPLDRYTIGYGGIAAPGEAAAIPDLACVSPSGCDVSIGPAAPVADLELYLYPAIPDRETRPADAV